MVEGIALAISFLALLYLFFRQTRPSTTQTLQFCDPLDRIAKDECLLGATREKKATFNPLKIEKKKCYSSLKKQKALTKMNDNREIVENQAYEEKERRQLAKGKAAIQRLHKRKNLLVYQEIMNKPKGLKNEIFPL